MAKQKKYVGAPSWAPLSPQKPHNQPKHTTNPPNHHYLYPQKSHKKQNKQYVNLPPRLPPVGHPQ
ncbi:hypothetical protein, partial [uncultured Muribaculum sp.]